MPREITDAPKISDSNDRSVLIGRISAPVFCAGAVLLIATSVLLGWTFEAEFLKRMVPGFVFMNPTTAVGLVLASIALLLVQSSEHRMLRPGQAIGCLVAMIGSIQLFSVFGIFDLGIDGILFQAQLFDTVTGQPNRIAPTTAVNFVLMGLAFTLVNVGAARRRDYFPAQYLIIAVLLSSFLAIIGFLYGANAFYVFASFNPMAIPTAISFFALALGLLLARTDRGIVREICQAGGGDMARRLFPIVIIIPIILGFLRLAGEKRGLYGSETGTAMMVVSIIFILGIVILHNARSMNAEERVRRLIEDALEASTRRERAMIESAQDVICSINADGIFVTVSPASRNVLGYAPEELIGIKYLDLIFPEDVAKVKEVAAKILSGEAQSNFETRYVHKNGSVVHLMSSGSWSDDEQLMFCVSRDITDRKRAEEAIFRMASIVESSQDGITSMTLDGTITSWNTGAKRILGYSGDEVIGRNVFEMFSDDLAAEEEETLARIKRGESVENYETHRVTKDGRIIPVSLTVSPIKDNNGNTIGVSKIARDITEQKLAEEKLQHSAAELMRSNAELQDFATVASHDLQEPLRKIQSFADELKSSLIGKIREDDLNTMERMIGAAGRMRTLINDLLTFSRVTTKGKPFTAVDLAVTVTEVLSDLQSRIDDTSGKIEVGHLPTIDADPMQMRQLLQNLIGNGLKFHRPGVPPVIRISGQNGGADCRLTVSDNGIGFDEKYLDRIFTVFQRLHGRNEYEGTGIGLAICRKIVERHGGNLTANSIPGEGATFTVMLPATQPQSMEELP